MKQIALVLFLSFPALAQISGPTFILSGTPPGGLGGGCADPTLMYFNVNTGVLATCPSTTLVWTAFANAATGNVPFGDITTGSNTAATMTVGTGASIVPSGTGAITATTLNANGIVSTVQPSADSTTAIQALSQSSSSLLSGTYTSGITATGSINQTCKLTSFNNGNVNGTATVALTGTNTIAGGTALVITNTGYGNTSASTSATAGNGTATCSGTATVATTLGQNSVVTVDTTNNRVCIACGVAPTDTVEISPFFFVSNSGGFKGRKFDAGYTNSGVDNVGGNVLGFGADLNSADGGFSRLGSGSIGVGTGTAGSTAGSLSMTGLTASGSSIILSGLGAASGSPNALCLNGTTVTVNAALTCTVSSRDYKQSIEELRVPSASAMLMRLRPVQFSYKITPARARWGFIAEEVADVDIKLGDAYDAGGIPRSLDQNAILALAVKTIQELTARVKALEVEMESIQRR